MNDSLLKAREIEALAYIQVTPARPARRNPETGFFSRLWAWLRARPAPAREGAP